jgi:hypothetical protein
VEALRGSPWQLTLAAYCSIIIFVLVGGGVYSSDLLRVREVEAGGPGGFAPSAPMEAALQHTPVAIDDAGAQGHPPRGEQAAQGLLCLLFALDIALQQVVCSQQVSRLGLIKPTPANLKP